MGGPLPDRPVDLSYLLGFPAGLGVGLLLVHDPGVGQVEQLGHREQVVGTQTVGFLPLVIALLVAAGGDDAVPVALLAVIPPDGDLQDAVADFVLYHVSIP